jgi:hypothetical protein
VPCTRWADARQEAKGEGRAKRAPRIVCKDHADRELEGKDLMSNREQAETPLLDLLRGDAAAEFTIRIESKSEALVRVA